MAAKPPLLALDTNFLLDLAADDNACKECLEVLRERAVKPILIVTPTVLAEIQHFAQSEYLPQSALARTALSRMLEWGLKPVNFTDGGMVRIAAQKILDADILPAQERNDARIIAEASSCAAHFFLSSDRQITGINALDLNAMLRDCHFPELRILWPQKVVQLLG
jgi:predicted nucleic acid-binding protein